MKSVRIDMEFESIFKGTLFKLCSNGTVSVAINDELCNWGFVKWSRVPLHIVIYTLAYGSVSDDVYTNTVMHKDQDPLNNRLENLRLVHRYKKLYPNVYYNYYSRRFEFRLGGSQRPPGTWGRFVKKFKELKECLEYFERYNKAHDYILTKGLTPQPIPIDQVPYMYAEPNIRCICRSEFTSDEVYKRHLKKKKCFPI